jgi:hypothetical protein
MKRFLTSDGRIVRLIKMYCRHSGRRKFQYDSGEWESSAKASKSLGGELHFSRTWGHFQKSAGPFSSKPFPFVEPHRGLDSKSCLTLQAPIGNSIVQELSTQITERCGFDTGPFPRLWKRYKFTGSGPWVRRVHAGCRCPSGADHIKLMFDTPCGRTGNSQALKESAEYPLAFAEKILDCWESAGTVKFTFEHITWKMQTDEPGNKETKVHKKQAVLDDGPWAGVSEVDQVFHTEPGNKETKLCKRQAILDDGPWAGVSEVCQVFDAKPGNKETKKCKKQAIFDDGPWAGVLEVDQVIHAEPGNQETKIAEDVGADGGPWAGTWVADSKKTSHATSSKVDQKVEVDDGPWAGAWDAVEVTKAHGKKARAQPKKCVNKDDGPWAHTFDPA